MGEAKRRKATREGRTWATGSIEVVANDVKCFRWSGTKHDAIILQKRYLDAVNAGSPVSANSYARRAAGYLMACGMPKVGDKDRRPSTFGQLWSASEVELYKAAILWLVLHEHIPNTGQRLEDVFVGKALVVKFEGDKDLVLESTLRELRGEPQPEGDDFVMMVGVLNYNHQLDPRDATNISHSEIFALAGKPLPLEASIGAEPMYVPRIPIDAAEADAMLKTIRIVVDATDPGSPARAYAGYTDRELSGGKPCVKVS